MDLNGLEKVRTGASSRTIRQRAVALGLLDPYAVLVSAEERSTLLELARGHPSPMRRVSQYEAALIRKMRAQSPAHAVMRGLEFGLFSLDDIAQTQRVRRLDRPLDTDVSSLNKVGALPILIRLAAGHTRAEIGRELGIGEAELTKRLAHAGELLHTRDETETVLRALVYGLFSPEQVRASARPMKNVRFGIQGLSSDIFSPAPPNFDRKEERSGAKAERDRQSRAQILEIAGRVTGQAADPDTQLRFLALVLRQGMRGAAGQGSSLAHRILQGERNALPPGRALDLAQTLWAQSDGAKYLEVTDIKRRLAVWLLSQALEATPADRAVFPALRMRRWMSELGWSPALIAYAEGDLLPGSLIPPRSVIRRARHDLFGVATRLLVQPHRPGDDRTDRSGFASHLLDLCSSWIELDELNPAVEELSEEAWGLMDQSRRVWQALHPGPLQYSRGRFTPRDRELLTRTIAGDSLKGVARQHHESRSPVEAEVQRLRHAGRLLRTGPDRAPDRDIAG